MPSERALGAAAPSAPLALPGAETTPRRTSAKTPTGIGASPAARASKAFGGAAEAAQSPKAFGGAAAGAFACRGAADAPISGETRAGDAAGEGEPHL